MVEGKWGIVFRETLIEGWDQDFLIDYENMGCLTTREDEDDARDIW